MYCHVSLLQSIDADLGSHDGDRQSEYVKLTKEIV